VLFVTERIEALEQAKVSFAKHANALKDGRSVDAVRVYQISATTF
jgi:hypothetical protein